MLQLFDASDMSERELERNIDCRNCTAVQSRHQDLPRSAYKSDSDCYSDCSSKDVNSGEDEWNDEPVNDQICYEQKDDGGVLNKRLNQIIIDEAELNGGSLQVTSASDENQEMCYHKGQWKGHSHPSQNMVFDNPILRLHESDPAVNSNSYLQTSIDTISERMVPSQLQFSTENIFLVSQQTDQGQNHETATFPTQSHKVKWNDQKYSRDSSAHFRKQGFGPYMIPRSKNHDAMTQHMVTRNEQTRHVQSQILPMQMTSICTQRLPHMQDPNNIQIPLPHGFMPQSAEGLILMQPQTSSTLDESVRGFRVPNDVRIPPEEFQHLLQTGRIVYMPSVIPRPPPCPPPETRGFVEDLHYEILNFARWTRPSCP